MMENSIEMAEGVAVGFSGHIHNFNADTEARLDAMMMEVGRWVESEAGVLLGHIKMAVVYEGKGITLNLTDMNEGVKHHDRLKPKEKVDFSFMAAVTDVDKHELEHIMLHAIEDSNVDFCLDEHECSCGHHHHHEHEHHDHGCSCGEHHDHDHVHSHEHAHKHVDANGNVYEHTHSHDHEHCHEHSHEEGEGHDHEHERLHREGIPHDHKH